MDWLNFYRGKRVFLSGNTGFKGSWMCAVLKQLGAEVIGYALRPLTEPNLFSMAGIGKDMISNVGNVCDADKLKDALLKAKPDVVIHMAAQPLVRESYRNPAETYAVNVMGTVNILEAVRHCDSVQVFLNVTTDKVYKNNEWEWGYRETDILDGFDPYSNSKSCSELVTISYVRSFFADSGTKIATARAGNVIGGGDYSIDRIIPDCVRAAEKGNTIIIRNPHSIRPYQHVLEPVCGYLLLVAKGASGSFNIGPDDTDCITTRNLVELFCNHWKDVNWECVTPKDAPHEAGFLKLDSSKIKHMYNWKPKWTIVQAVEKTVEWHKSIDKTACMEGQIKEYLQ